MRCWSYCQTRARRCPHSGEERAKQHPMALGMQHPSVKATWTYDAQRKDRRELTPSPHEEQQQTLPYTSLCQSPTHPIPLGTDMFTVPLLPGHLIDVSVHVSPQNQHIQGPSLTPHSAAGGPIEKIPRLRQVRPCQARSWLNQGSAELHPSSCLPEG